MQDNRIDVKHLSFLLNVSPPLFYTASIYKTAQKGKIRQKIFYISKFSAILTSSSLGKCANMLNTYPSAYHKSVS